MKTAAMACSPDRDVSRWLGLFPLLFVAWTAQHYIRIGEAWTVLWLCDICNVLLACGLFWRRADWVWISTLWLWVGTPLWIWDDALRGVLRIHAVFIHVGSGLIGLHAMRRWPRPGVVWRKAVLLLIGLQLFCRMFAPPALNVNLAHAVHPALADWFPSYATYWAFNVASFSGVLCLLETTLDRMLRRTRPAG